MALGRACLDRWCDCDGVCVSFPGCDTWSVKKRVGESREIPRTVPASVFRFSYSGFCQLRTNLLLLIHTLRCENIVKGIDQDSFRSLRQLYFEFRCCRVS